MLRALLIFLVNISLFSFEKEVKVYIDKIESVHTKYCSGNFEFDFFSPDKIFTNELQNIENVILMKYRRESIQYNYLNLLMSLVLCDVSYLINDPHKYNDLIQKLIRNYNCALKISLEDDNVPADYFRALGELAINLIPHNRKGLYSYFVNAKRHLETALKIDGDNVKAFIPLSILYTVRVSNRDFYKILFAKSYIDRAEDSNLNDRQKYLKELVKSSFLIRTNRRLEAIECLKKATAIFPNGNMAVLAIEKLKEGNSFYY
ncbi:hypothetical protein B1U23_05940 (plasmid) [Borreliella burgdorferi]|uniref:Tetratricopeptide repeat domain protein n=1 Tax=Borreliella burgdorferi (strain ATCC 35210 / DSM 4680 / CIP 102532 / B31) TaxID=224326 RepID=O50779_BORBU|nr:hypothetical protein [Borreliella burgdorferi]AAC66120.1 conserved hypothetical protein [Borreliella burgdorferi B31]ARS30891.1 hypothetical protein B1U23_05940 [Borreliella burgdorferi]ARS32633.1 hypothetical protein B1U21_01975 [Borreliella burgdorferi]MCR8876276.1 hypothetical protein [Borreliella burgdorferi]PRR10868.1 hypothetical protein CV660_05615 [Borreliella burgdorferi]